MVVQWVIVEKPYVTSLTLYQRSKQQECISVWCIPTTLVATTRCQNLGCVPTRGYAYQGEPETGSDIIPPTPREQND